jgi:hypothetical protein
MACIANNLLVQKKESENENGENNNGRATWAQIRMRWKAPDLHYWDDLCPVVDRSYHWEKLVHVGDVPESQWYSGEELTRSLPANCVAIWIYQKMTVEQYKDLRMGCELFIAVILDDYIQVLKMNKFTVEPNILLFNSSDWQKLRILVGLGLGSMQVPNLKPAEVKKKIIYVHLVMQSPNISLIEAYEGDGKPWANHEIDGVNYLLCYKKKEEKISIPDALKMVWLGLVRKVPDRKDFLDPTYYEIAMDSYVAATFHDHHKQMSQILSQIPSSKRIVAPGDGLGIVQSIRPDAIVGDLYSTVSSVPKETFLQTLVRGKRADKLSILILSYVTSLMSEIELYSCSNWEGPVIWIDSSQRCPLPGMRLAARNVYERGVHIGGCISKEIPTPSEYTRYTENLLSLEAIQYIGRNDAVAYWESMRPFGKSSRYDGGVAPVVVGTLEEYSAAIVRNVSNIYYAPLGQLNPLCVPVRLKEENDLSYRQIYAIPADHRLVRYLKEIVHYGVSNDSFFFTATKQSDYEIILHRKEEKLSIKFRAEDNLPPLIELISCNGSEFILHTVYGLRKCVVRSKEDWESLDLYLVQFGDGQWQKKLSDQFQSIRRRLPSHPPWPAGPPWYHSGFSSFLFS